MNALEANALLTKAALIDPRSKPDADRAMAWAELLADINFTDANVALISHLRESDEAVRPVHILRRVHQMEDERALDKVDADLSIEVPVVDPAERRAFLRELMPDVFGEESQA